jgi:CheY-like chemotaxis protein
LTGGIAHDFNNLLAVIQGNTELLSEQVGEGKQSRELRAILRASARGAQLTQRLLAFSRKQTLLPQPVDVNDLISSMMDMFGRTLGDDVLIVFKPAPDLPAAQVDPGQLENALLNLAINARDAMADGGEVTISSSSAYLSGEETEMVSGESPDAVKPGRYVVVEVRDTGKGIPADQLDKVWEPFFTTKRAGQGTGLGLSMVYGFLRQSGGQVAIDSRVGEGTTVTLFLPCAAGNEALRARTADITGVPTGTEYIFVIDDDVEIRVMVQKFLSRLGYRVVTAGSAEESFEKLVSHGKPDLFVSDVMLPGGNRGPNIVAGARKRFGPIPAVFMSGHAVAGFADVLGEGRKVTLINKPFELNQLARAVRRALDSSGDAGA